MENLNKELIENRYLLLPFGKHPLSSDKINKIDTITKLAPAQSIVAGDAGDTHQLNIARFRNDVEKPTDLHPATTQLMTLIDDVEMQVFYQLLTDFARACIRRCQLNILKAGDFVGYHTDAHGDPRYPGTHEDYKFTIVFHFNQDDYQGGDTILYLPTGKARIQLPSYSMLITCGDLPHEVNKVTQGIRKTLVIFLSDNFGITKEKQV